MNPPTGRGAGEIVPQRLTVIASTTVEFDSRTHRVAATFAERGHEVTILARAAEGLSADVTTGRVRILRVEVSATEGLPLPAVVRRWLRHRERPAQSGVRWPATMSRLARATRVALVARGQALAMAAIAPPADAIHAMALLSLPTALAVSRRHHGTPVVYDARDIYADAANVARLPGFARRALAGSERRWARQASRVVTVNEPYADVLAERLGPPRPAVVMNGQRRATRPASSRPRFHDRLGLAPEQRVVLYHGGFSPDRGIEQLIEALPRLDERTVLVLMGYGSLQDDLVRRAADLPLAGRLHVLPAVPPPELLEWVGSADIVAMPIQPSTLNHRLTTPNKLFEAMAAGVPVVASDLPGMAPIVAETGCGVVCDPTDPAAIADAIRSIFSMSPADREAMSLRALAAAAGPYSWEAQVEVLLEEYGRLTGRPW
jgi:glycosyltransferase involved in cell wall biosynthesis